MSARPWLALAALCSIGCGDDPVRILGGACAFGPELRLAEPESVALHGLALATDGARAWAVWSEDAGAFARSIGGDGAPDADAVRLGPACTAGLDAAVRGDALVVACARRGDPSRADEGGIAVLTVVGASVRVERALGPVGPEGDGVSVAVAPDGGVHVGWQSAEGATSAAWIVDGAEEAVAERLSPTRARATAPSLGFRGDERLVAWAESWLDAEGRVDGRLELRVGPRAVHAAEALAHDAAAPRLAPGVDGAWTVAFRDRRPRGHRPRVHLASLPAGEAALGEPVGAAHANAEGAAVTVSCGPDVFVVAPRTHNRIERLVSVRRHRGDLAPRGPEQQIYEFGTAFEHADAACVGGRLLVVVGSRPTRVQPRGSVRAVAVSCGDQG